MIATAYAACCFQAASKPALAASVTSLAPSTIIIAYFYFCNNNFQNELFDSNELNFGPAMETQAGNENASQAQRTSSDDPEKL
jgi:hypothetical protein